MKELIEVLSVALLILAIGAAAIWGPSASPLPRGMLDGTATYR